MLTGLTVTILQYIQIFCKPKTNVICHLLAWEIPWTEENGGLQAMWLQRVGYDLTTQKYQQ